MSKKYKRHTVLIKDLRSNQEAAFQYIVQQFNSPLCAYAESLCLDQEKAKDIVQMVFVNVWKSRKRLDSNLSLTNYLYKAVYHTFLKSVRQHKSYQKLLEKYAETIHQYDTPHEFSEMVDIGLILEKHLKHLPPQCQKIFRLHKLEGLTLKETAQYLNLSSKTIENQISKAYKLLRKNIRNSNSSIAENILFWIWFSIGTNGCKHKT